MIHSREDKVFLGTQLGMVTYPAKHGYPLRPQYKVTTPNYVCTEYRTQDLTVVTVAEFNVGTHAWQDR